jgi:hypothetical protein
MKEKMGFRTQEKSPPVTSSVVSDSSTPTRQELPIASCAPRVPIVPSTASAAPA